MPSQSAMRLPHVAAAIFACLALLSAQPAPAQSPAAGVEFFERKVRPLLAEQCYSCHSARANKLKGGLRLDTPEGLTRGGTGGPVIAPGNPDASRLILAVRQTDKDLSMPPKGRLTEAQIADLEAWVKAGAVVGPDVAAAEAAATAENPFDLAEARKFWSFRPPKRHPAPDVRRQDWARSPVDRFILAKLEEKGVAPTSPADRRTLIRRAYYDLVGLPPTPEEVEAFVNDSPPDAFAKVVDRLLASPHYGERWGRHWLDLVRYTDSFDSRGMGGEADVPESWRYRDWVVKSFNEDLPYDQFVMRQIAGDLLASQGPGKFDPDGIVATGVFALGEWGIGDADKEKMLTDIVDDQIDVTGRAFLGMTLACARCHDHKYDPVSAADYYGLAGIFFSSHILPGPGPKTAGSPVARIQLLSPEEIEQRKLDRVRVTDLGTQVERLLDEQYAALAARVLPDLDRYLLAAWEYRTVSTSPPPLDQFAAERKLHPYVLRRFIDFIGNPSPSLFAEATADVRGVKGLAGWRNPGGDTPSMLAYNGTEPARFLTITMPPRSVAVHPSPKAGVAVGWKSPIAGNVKITGRVMDADGNCGDGIAWTIAHRKGRSSAELARGEIANGAMQMFMDAAGAAALTSVAVAQGDMIELAVLPKGDHGCDTTVVELEIVSTDGAPTTWNLTSDVVSDVHEKGAGNPHSDAHGNPDVWHFYDLAGQFQAGHAPDGSGLARWLELVGDPKSPNAPKPDRADLDALAQEVRDALIILDGQADWLRQQNTAAYSLAGPDVPFYKVLTDPKGSFWWTARGVDANLPAGPREQVASMRAEREGLERKLAAPVPVAHGLQEGGTPNTDYAGFKDARIFLRGDYNKPAATVPRRLPVVLAGEQQPPIAKGSGRLELARWVASPDNPLTARVMVNRIWQYHFGEGLVRTPNNFGKLGTPPTHPELLDWLALKFIESNWSIKAIHRELMLSATYQQSSHPDPATLAADPENLLWGRMTRRRLDAEALRDSLLAVAGMLDRTPGGKAVADPNTPRRTLYLMTVRSDRSNYRSLFDAADPGSVAEKRIESTVAPQALFLLNHPTVLAQVEALASRVLKQPSADDRGRVRSLYQFLFGRDPQAKEFDIGLKFLADTQSAGVTEQAAWEQYCQLLLCTNEFMYVD